MNHRMTVTAMLFAMLLCAGLTWASAPTNVTVFIEGPDQGWVGENLAYSAAGTFDLDGETQTEVNNGQATVEEKYEWTYGPATLVGGDANSPSITVSYQYNAGGAYQTISVVYTVTITYVDETSDSGFDDDNFEVKVMKPVLLDVAGGGTIAAGHVGNAAHMSALTATVTNGFGEPAPGWDVSFDIQSQDWVVAPAQFLGEPVETDWQGKTSRTLISSDKVCTVTVSISGDWPQTPELVQVAVELPMYTPAPDPQEDVYIALGGSTQLNETLSLPTGPVPEHSLSWEFVDVTVYNGNGVLIDSPTPAEFGNIDPNPTNTNGQGEGATTYHSGSAAGFITLKATDMTCYNAGNEHPELHTFEIVVVRLDHLEVYDAYQVGDTSTWAAGISDTEAYVTIEAVLLPGVSEEDAVNIISWEGGLAVDANALLRQVSRTQTGTTEVTATVGTTSESVTIKVCEITGVSVVSGAGSVFIEDVHHAPTSADEEDTDGVVLQAQLSPEISPVPQGLLQWMGGTGVPDHPEQRKVSRTHASKEEVACECGDSSAEITVWVIEIDLGIAGVSADDEDTPPGGAVLVNSDDDNGNSTQDRNESPVAGENDLISLVLEITPSDVPAGTVTLTCSTGVALWDDDVWWTPLSRHENRCL